ncbi:DEAD/DEAH box helicase [Streptomyces sp. NPDC049040]|uniref:DEAD/DEAH box helicase n=1 Tax=Streptomyces sp. NPDC049040 TaxID=3365593 RepID=UPI0037186E08
MARAEQPAGPAVADRRLLLARLPELAAGEVDFLPAESPREGRMAFRAPGSDPEDAAVLLLPVDQALPLLTRCRALGADGTGRASTSAALWGAAAVMALALLARGRVQAAPDGSAGCRIGPLDAADHTRLATLAADLPPGSGVPDAPGHDLPAPPGTDLPPGAGPGGPFAPPEAEALVLAFLDAVADSLTRTPPARTPVAAPAVRAVPAPRPVPAARTADAAEGPEVSLRLELGDEGAARAVVQLRSPADPAVLADAAEVWSGAVGGPGLSGRRARAEVERTLRRAARVWPPARRLLEAAVPAGLELSDGEAAALLGEAATRLAAAGVAVHWPRDLVRGLTSTGVLEPAREGPRSAAETFVSSGGVLDFRWRVALGDLELTEEELERLVAAHRPVVRLRDRWVVVDQALVRRLRRAARSGTPSLTAIQALGAALTGSVEVDGERVAVGGDGVLEELRARVAEPAAAGRGERTATGAAAGSQGPPQALAATLRDYQLRGLDWLHRMTALGLGACLADDMGLGKTVTLIALHLRRQEQAATAGPTLVVCPASLLGNWEREIRRFAPTAPVHRYHGPGRELPFPDPSARDLPAPAVAASGFVLTTYGTMRRDADRLAAYDWGLLVADEAQHVKNPHAHTARALRAIPSRGRVALTGTPVENNLTELWALLDWTTPGLLGTLPAFRDRHARAVEGDRDEEAAARLAALVGPFLLRRRKSDPGVAPELPPKTETDRPVSLTREQVSLYEALVRESLAEIEGSGGIARRGLVMKLLTGLKQVCNHPAHFLKEPAGARLPGRSGKLRLLDEILDTVLAEGGSALVFTQYVAMGRLIEHHLADRGVGTLFLHGGTAVGRREQMVDAFQAGDERVFLLSLKAAGTGLNLTRAEHVIHYDRWWNPAVEDQATDRAHRIGQTRPVQVHRLIAEGTVEDRVAEMLRSKRELADAVLASGEGVFGEMSDGELADLVTLRRPRR